MLNHCDADRIQADYELSERLGAEILAAGCESLAPSPKVKSYATRWDRKVNLVTGHVTITQVTEEV